MRLYRERGLLKFLKRDDTIGQQLDHKANTTRQTPRPGFLSPRR
jgi:hypothetical protein